MRNLNLYIIIILLLNSCGNPSSKTTKEEPPIDTLSTEQTNPNESSKKLSTTSEHVIEDELAIIQEPVTFDPTGKPSRPVFRNIEVDTSQLFGIWAQDLTGPHADFRLTEDSYFIVDFDGNGNVSYILDGRSLTVYFDYGPWKSSIISVNSDSMRLRDNEMDWVTTYYRWNQ